MMAERRFYSAESGVLHSSSLDSLSFTSFRLIFLVVPMFRFLYLGGDEFDVIFISSYYYNFKWKKR